MGIVMRSAKGILMAKKCDICGKSVILNPSAAERAEKDGTGKTAQYYTNLFPRHAQCELDKRRKDTSEALKRSNEEYAKRPSPHLVGPLSYARPLGH
jgi:hypothetical protein